jgi:hypothetical protein
MAFGQTTNSLLIEQEKINQVHDTLPNSENVPIQIQPIQSTKNKVNIESLAAKDSESNMKFKQLNADFIQTYNASNLSVERRSATFEEQAKMDEDVEIMQLINPNSVETRLNTYLANHYNPLDGSILIYAAKAAPNNEQVLKNLAIHYQLFGSKQASDSTVLELKNRAIYNQNHFNYCEALLASCTPNSTLIVHGIDDFIPVAYLNNQHPEKLITIISLELLQSSSYRNQLKIKGYHFPLDSMIDPNFLFAFQSLNTSKNFQLSMTLPEAYFTPFLPTLIPYGLTFSPQALLEQNFQWNDQLWQKKWSKSTITGVTYDRCDSLSSNFLPALINLEKQYEIVGRTNEQIELQQALKLLAKRSKKEAMLKSIGID